MYQQSSKHMRSYESEFEKCMKNMNSDYFGEESMTQKVSSSHSRIKSLNRTELSTERSKSRNRIKGQEIESVEKLNMRILKESKKMDALISKPSKKSGKQQTNQKNNKALKKLSIQIRQKSIRRMQTKTKPSSREDTDQYFGSLKSTQKKSQSKFSDLTKKLEEKAIQSYRDIKKKTSLNNPASKKREIQEFLKKEKSLTILIQKSSLQKTDQKIGKSSQLRDTSIILDPKEEGCKGSISKLLQNFNHFIPVSDQSLELQEQKQVTNPESIKRGSKNELLNQLNLNKMSRVSEYPFANDQLLCLQSNLKASSILKNPKSQNQILTRKILQHHTKTSKTEKTASKESESLQSTLSRISKHIKIVERFMEFQNSGNISSNGSTSLCIAKGREIGYLNFLIYKKYCVQRSKIQNSLYGYLNCFILKCLQVSNEQLSTYKNQVKKLLSVLREENKKILQKFENYFRDRYDTRLDIFSKESNKILNRITIKQLNKEFLRLLNIRSKLDNSEKDARLNQRIIWCIQLTYLIQQLEGNLIKQFSQFQNITDFDTFLYENIAMYRKEIQEYT